MAAILTVINAAAEAYRGVIPLEMWHEPYMSPEELCRNFQSGVVFWGIEADGELVGVMGMQPVRDVNLIRHAYVKPGCQRQGVGGTLINYLISRSERVVLVGTWATASWAINFYRRHGFAKVPRERTNTLLKFYWEIPDRQVDASVVLANGPLDTIEGSQVSPRRDVGVPGSTKNGVR